MTRTYRSKRDAWIVVVLWFSMVAVIAGIAATWFSHGTPAAVRALSAVVVLIVVPLVFSTLYNTRYTFEENALRIVSGPFRWTVPYSEIDSVTPSNNTLSSPALSLDRLEVRWSSSRMVLISPENREMFLQDLAAAAPQLARAGDSLRRR